MLNPLELHINSTY